MIAIHEVEGLAQCLEALGGEILLSAQIAKRAQ